MIFVLLLFHFIHNEYKICDILIELSNALPVFDVICERVLSFITKCVLRHAILHGHMTSLERSALYCGLRFKFDIGRLLDLRFDYCNLVWNNYLSNVSAEISQRHGFTLAGVARRF